MFIEDYRNNEILWNFQNFKNNIKKLYIFKNLNEKYGSDIVNLKKKIKNLKTQLHHVYLTNNKSVIVILVKKFKKGSVICIQLNQKLS
jgi:thiamine pyrophosphokinase